MLSPSPATFLATSSTPPLTSTAIPIPTHTTFPATPTTLPATLPPTDTTFFPVTSTSFPIVSSPSLTTFPSAPITPPPTHSTLFSKPTTISPAFTFSTSAQTSTHSISTGPFERRRRVEDDDYDLENVDGYDGGINLAHMVTALLVLVVLVILLVVGVTMRHRILRQINRIRCYLRIRRLRHQLRSSQRRVTQEEDITPTSSHHASPSRQPSPSRLQEDERRVTQEEDITPTSSHHASPSRQPSPSRLQEDERRVTLEEEDITPTSSHHATPSRQISDSAHRDLSLHSAEPSSHTDVVNRLRDVVESVRRLRLQSKMQRKSSSNV
ncbi:hepatitis A virus cellular receptor 1-like [Haliotis rubra]|uniref:hepatitis A virus cellular receptor 1-like n=1 Tax=Haliotis rubra TaxID=36100 RepID=UPI001EE6055F|nr:hepatitis A virus cellular receptor 1-like [Haliotis rubra]